MTLRSITHARHAKLHNHRHNAHFAFHSLALLTAFANTQLHLKLLPPQVTYAWRGGQSQFIVHDAAIQNDMSFRHRVLFNLNSAVWSTVRPSSGSRMWVHYSHWTLFWHSTEVNFALNMFETSTLNMPLWLHQLRVQTIRSRASRAVNVTTGTKRELQTFRVQRLLYLPPGWTFLYLHYVSQNEQWLLPCRVLADWHLGALSKLRNTSYVSVRPSVRMEQLDSH